MRRSTVIAIALVALVAGTLLGRSLAPERAKPDAEAVPALADQVPGKSLQRPSVAAPLQATAAVPADARAQRALAQQASDKRELALMRRYQSEATDPYWSASATQALANASKSQEITALSADISNLRVDCRSSVCALQGDFPTRTAAQDWVTLFMMNAAAHLPSATYRLRDKGGRVVVEIYGEGRRL